MTSSIQIPEPYVPSKPAGDIYRCAGWDAFHDDDPDAPGELHWVNADDWDGMPMFYYDGYLELEDWPAGWYCDDCVDYIFTLGPGTTLDDSDAGMRVDVERAFESHLVSLIPMLYEREGRGADIPEHVKVYPAK